jgi:hypothetical protein
MQEIYNNCEIIKFDDNEYFYSYKSYNDAHKASLKLKEIGITGGSGNMKYVAKHMNGCKKYGLIMTNNNENYLFEKMNIEDLVEYIGYELSNKNNFYQMPYRDSFPGFMNLYKALKLYLENKDTDEKFDNVESDGHLATHQSNIIGETFIRAIDTRYRGSVADTINKIIEMRSKYPDLRDMLINSIIKALKYADEIIMR